MYCGLPKGIALTLQSLEKSIERRHRHLDRKEEENKENVNNIKEANNAIDSYTNTINNKDKNITHISSKNKKNNNESPVIGNMNLPLANDEKGHDNHYMRRAVSAKHHRYSSSGEKNKSPNGQCCRSGLQASFYAIDAMTRLQQGLPPQVSPAEIPIVESGVAGSLKANISSSSPIVVNTVVSTVSVEDQRDEFPLSVLLFGVGEDEERERMILEEFSKECYLYLQQYNHRTENIISDRERLIQMESEIQALQLENKQFRDTVDSSRRDAVVNAVSYATVQQRKDAIIDGLRNDLCQRDQSLQDLLERDKIEEEEKYKKNKIINTLKKHNKLLRIEKEDLCQKLKQLQASEAYNMQLLEEVQTNIVSLEAQHKSLIFRASGTGDTLSGVNISEHSGDPSSKAAPLPQVDELRVAEAMEAAGEWREKYLKSTKTITSLSMRIKELELNAQDTASMARELGLLKGKAAAVKAHRSSNNYLSRLSSSSRVNHIPSIAGNMASNERATSVSSGLNKRAPKNNKDNCNNKGKGGGVVISNKSRSREMIISKGDKSDRGDGIGDPADSSLELSFFASLCHGDTPNKGAGSDSSILTVSDGSSC